MSKSVANVLRSTISLSLDHALANFAPPLIRYTIRFPSRTGRALQEVLAVTVSGERELESLIIENLPRQQGRRIEGRKSYRDINPELVRVAKRLVHGNRKNRLSLRDISSKLAEMGHLTGQGTPFSATQIKRLIEA